MNRGLVKYGVRSQLSYTPMSKSIIANYGANVKMFFRVSAKKIFLPTYAP